MGGVVHAVRHQDLAVLAGVRLFSHLEYKFVVLGVLVEALADQLSGQGQIAWVLALLAESLRRPDWLNVLVAEGVSAVRQILWGREAAGGATDHILLPDAFVPGRGGVEVAVSGVNGEVGEEGVLVHVAVEEHGKRHLGVSNVASGREIHAEELRDVEAAVTAGEQHGEWVPGDVVGGVGEDEVRDVPSVSHPCPIETAAKVEWTSSEASFGLAINEVEASVELFWNISEELLDGASGGDCKREGENSDLHFNFFL